MNETNPYESPAARCSVDTHLMRSVATNLNAARQNPPTVVRTMTTWPGVPLLFIVGVIGTLILAAISISDNSVLTSHWPIGVASAVFGAILRDFGLARRVARVWPAQCEFINWDKVDRYAE